LESAATRSETGRAKPDAAKEEIKAIVKEILSALAHRSNPLVGIHHGNQKTAIPPKPMLKKKFVSGNLAYRIKAIQTSQIDRSNPQIETEKKPT
jgi:hypothetical protein